MQRMLQASAVAWRTDVPVLLLVLGYVCAVAVLGARVGFMMPPVGEYIQSAKMIFEIALLLWGTLFVLQLIKVRPDAPFGYVRTFVREWRLSERFYLALPAIVAMGVFSNVFSSMKTAIPLLAPFAWDPVFVRADEFIHGGDAWRLLHPLLGYPVVSFILSLAYYLWIPLLFVIVLSVAGWIERPKERLQFLIAYFLCWIVLGTIGAVGMSSVGPCFYEYFYGDDRFSPLMAYLRYADTQFSLSSLDVQDLLIQWAQDMRHGLGKGISAMPSLHVAIATLYALLGWRVSRAWGAAATLFLALICLGSVHLGFHYAVDGYVSLLVAPILWWVAGLVAERWLARRSVEVALPAGPSTAAPEAAAGAIGT